MAIQAMALQVQNPQINAVQDFQSAQANALTAKSTEMNQEAAALQQLAEAGYGVLEHNLDGPINQQRLDQMLGLMGNNPLVEKIKANPELIRTITKGSLAILAVQNDQAKSALEKQKLEQEINANTAKLNAPPDAPKVEKRYNPQTGLEENVVWNGEQKTWDAFGGQKAPDAADAGSVFDDTSSVRKEIQQLPTYKNYSQAKPIYDSMLETAGRNSRASDLNLVYGLGKIMDPTSVVREGEMVMVKNTGSLPEWLIGTINSLNGGAAMLPETREAIMREAYGRMKAYDQALSQDLQMYKGIVDRNKMNPADVLPTLQPLTQFTLPTDPNAPPATPATPAAPIVAPTPPANGVHKSWTDYFH